MEVALEVAPPERQAGMSAQTAEDTQYGRVGLTNKAIRSLREVSYELTTPERGRVTLSKAILLLIDFYRQNGIERDEFAEVIESLNRSES